VLFDENQQHSSPSQLVSSVLTQTTQDPYKSLPHLSGAQRTIVPSSIFSGAPASLLPPEGSLTIIASSSCTFRPYVSLLYDSLPVLDYTTTHLNPPLDDN
jgi:hypothetical protein